MRTQVGGLGVANVLVIFTPSPAGTTYKPPTSGRTLTDGTYSISVGPGSYMVTFLPDRRSGLLYGLHGAQDPFAYKPYLGQAAPEPLSPNAQGTLVTVNGDTTGIDGVLGPGYLISGRITDATTGQPITDSGNAAFRWIYPSRQTDKAGGYDTYSISTGLNGSTTGQYSIWVPAGTFALTAWSLSKYGTVTKTVTVSAGDVNGIDFALPPR